MPSGKPGIVARPTLKYRQRLTKNDDALPNSKLPRTRPLALLLGLPFLQGTQAVPRRAATHV